MTRLGFVLLLVLGATLPAKADVRDDLGRALAAQKEGEGQLAISLYSGILERGELSPDLAAVAHNNRALALAAIGRPKRAIEDYDAGLALRPDDPDLLFNRALARLGRQQPERAMVDARRLLELTPEDSEAQLLSGQVKAALKQHESAIVDFKQALDLEPDMAQAYRDLGFSLSATGQHGRALADYDTALALQPDDPKAYRGRGDVMRRLGRLQEAIGDYDQSIALDPADAGALYGRGLARKALGRYESATGDFGAAIDSWPEFGAAYKQRGIIHFYRGNFAAAARDLRQSLKTDGARPYRLLWLYLARSRAGFDGREELEAWARKLKPDAWPGPVVALLRGETKPAQLLASIDATTERRRREMRCEAYFYIGQLQLLEDDPGAAADSFRRAIQTGITTFIEYKGAEVELEKMARRLPAIAQRDQSGAVADGD